MNRYLMAPLALALCAALAGCAPGGAPLPATRSVAASIAAGRAYDVSQGAVRSGNDALLRAAGRDYARQSAKIVGARNLSRAVYPIVFGGMALDDLAQSAPFLQRPRLRAQALEKYRAASEFLPAQPALDSVDADTPNLVGYQLADRGTTRADWERAEQLTRLALADWDRQIKALPKGSKDLLSLQAARTVGPLDSHAWALFRLGRLKEARQQQERVMQFATKNPAVLTAELPFHLAEIYRALGRDDDAREQYNAALALNPDPELAIKIDAAVNGKII